MFGWMEILVILFVVLLLFGAKRLPSLGKALGESVKNFKKGVKDRDSRDVSEVDPPDNSNGKS